ncbi:MAG TPA: class I SAM-dependent methyltransferase [Micromonosporaceae bacterium]|jgi:SAM-dependent methyltransferase
MRPVDDAYFREMYASSPDPWSFAERWYDRRKYALTLAALPQERYRSGFEPACSIGVLSAGLAERCDSLLCTDLVDEAVDRARERLAGYPHVTVRRQALPDWPDGHFDLIVLSEVLYYLTDEELFDTLTNARASLEPGGHLVSVHWRHPVAEHRRRGDEVHAAVNHVDGLHRLAAYHDPDFRLDVFARVPPMARSVAQAEGLSP